MIDPKEHLKAIGRAIIEDADKFNVDPYTTASIVVAASITPDGVTSVKYIVNRYADPRTEVTS